MTRIMLTLAFVGCGLFAGRGGPTGESLCECHHGIIRCPAAAGRSAAARLRALQLGRGRRTLAVRSARGAPVEQVEEVGAKHERSQRNCDEGHGTQGARDPRWGEVFYVE